MSGLSAAELRDAIEHLQFQPGPPCVTTVLVAWAARQAPQAAGPTVPPELRCHFRAEHVPVAQLLGAARSGLMTFEQAATAQHPYLTATRQPDVDAERLATLRRSARLLAACVAGGAALGAGGSLALQAMQWGLGDAHPGGLLRVGTFAAAGAGLGTLEAALVQATLRGRPQAADLGPTLGAYTEAVVTLALCTWPVWGLVVGPCCLLLGGLGAALGWGFVSGAKVGVVGGGALGSLALLGAHGGLRSEVLDTGRLPA